MHEFIARSLDCNWRFLAQECPTFEDAMELFRKPSFVGGVVTMPYKTTIMAHFDGLDDHCVKIGACNNVYRATDGSLRGMNTDWRGIKSCLTFASDESKGRPALIIDVGGACRAAVHALYEELRCTPIYAVNRDEGKVKDLLEDTKPYGSGLQIIHLRSVEEATSLTGMPYYIVGTVSDFEPQTSAEIEARDILVTILSSSREKGVLLDMCFKPRITRTLKVGEQHGWTMVEGTGIIAIRSTSSIGYGVVKRIVRGFPDRKPGECCKRLCRRVRQSIFDYVGV